MKYFFAFIIFSGIAYVSCTDPVSLGADLVGAGGEIGVDVTDTFHVKSRMVLNDSSITFRKLEDDIYPAFTYMVGEVEDDTFGRSSAISYFSAHLFRAMPDLSGLTVDSVIMVLRLDSLGQYGSEQTVHDLELFRLMDNIPAENTSDTLFSNLELDYEQSAISSLSKRIGHNDSLSITSYTGDTLIKVGPQLRMPLDVQFWKDNSVAFADSTDYLTNLNDILKGYALKSSPDNNSMIGLDLYYNPNVNIEASSVIKIYYQPTDTTKEIYNLRLGRLRHSYFENDYNGSLLEAQSSLADPEYLFLQSQAGAYLEFDLSEIGDIQDRILNYAGLRLVLDNDQGSYDPVPQVFAFYRDENNELINIADLRTSDLNFFGGFVETETINGIDWEVYNMNLTNQLNALIDQDISNGKIVILPNSRAQRPERSLIFGPGNIDQPPVLQLVLSNP